MPVQNLYLDLSILIVSWNVKEYLRACLKSIFNTVYNIPFEIIAVDNNSSDDTVSIIRNEFPSIRLIENKENRGFAAAANQALQHAKGEYSLFLNPDTVMMPGTIEGIIDFIKSNPQAGIATCRKIDSDGNQCVLDNFFLNYDPFSFPFRVYLKTTVLRILSELSPDNKAIKKAIFNMCASAISSPPLNAPQPFECYFTSGCFMMIRRKAIEEIGGFDERFFLEKEDIDLCCRMKSAGWKSYLCPQYEIIHLGQKSIDQWDSHEIASIRTYSSFLFYSKYKGKVRLFFRVLKIISTKTILSTILLIFKPIFWLKSLGQEDKRENISLSYLAKESTDIRENLSRVIFEKKIHLT